MKLQNWINWHRTLGFAATIFVLVLSVTGLLLNHTNDLKLDEIYVENDMLLDWYGIAPEKSLLSYRSASHWLTQIDGRLYLDETEITGDSEKLLGTVMSGDIIIAAYMHSLYLFTQTGELIEKLTVQRGVPAELLGIGLGPEDEIIVRSHDSNYYTNAEMQDWMPYPKVFSNWSTSDSMPESMEKNILRIYRGKGITLEKLLIDVHSGRILGTAGAFLVDLAAIIFIVLAISGWCVWLKRRAMLRQLNGTRLQ